MSNNIAKQIIESAKTSLIDSSIESSELLRPKLLYNNHNKGNTVFANIESELQVCDSFWFSVAFITRSGMILLKDLFSELDKKGIEGRLLTTDYLSFSEPKALRELLQFNNIEVKVYSEEDFHTKGYMFTKTNDSETIKTFIVGSSNLTQTALKKNKEWNLKISSLEEGELIEETNDEFEAMWNEATPLTEEWINEYELSYKKIKATRPKSKIARLKTYTLKPNKMQVEATKALAQLRKEEKDKALLISATGTGKTYLSAFDVRNFKPKKMLFLAHREMILNQARESFLDVMGDDINVGMLGGGKKDYDADFLFSTVQTISKDDVIEKFEPDYFDYIVVDETHKAGANTYRKIIDYFKPKFMLGMTASPERTDGYDIYKTFDNNIAYEIRLQKAMEEDLLCPFHYFGISDLEVDGETINDNTEFRYLVSEERVDHIIEKAEFYGHSGDRVKGLIFCGRNDEAKELSEAFNKRGYNTVALSGADSEEERERQVRRLEQDEKEKSLDYIFTVDIFNEGVDIPSVNQVIMLRPTESPIVFVQQLGRGLRKYNDKEYVVVLDFIGNYQNNFMIPIALSGDRTYNKDNIRKYLREGSRIIPGCSTIHFDEISKARIFKAIDKMTTTKKMLADKYNQLKYKLGRIPTIVDFYDLGEVDPLLFIEYSKTYDQFVRLVDKDYLVKFNEKEEKTLEFISSLIVNGKRIHELLLLKLLFDNEKITESLFREEIESRGEHYKKVDYISAINVINKEFLTNNEANKYTEVEIIEERASYELFRRTVAYVDILRKKEFLTEVKNLIEYGMKKYNDTFKEHDEDNFVLYQKYSRKDVCRLLNWEKDDSATIFGYRIKHNTCPIFVTYEKKEDISESTKYDDHFETPHIFSWMTRSNVKIESREPQEIINHEESGLKIYLFVKKSDDEGKDFYYMGKVAPKKWVQTTQDNDEGKELPIVNFTFEMENDVRDDIYEYITR